MTTDIPDRPRTLAEKVWDDHLVVKGENGEPDLIYIDLHLVHEVTSPQAFDGLRAEGRPVRRLDLTIATEDHNTPTLEIDKPIADLTSRTQIETLRRNAEEFGVRLHSLGDKEQGIVHVVGPQLGLTMPGITVVCGDSHTSTHGAFGAMAFGIGTSEVEHVLATQTLPLKPFKTMAITVEGSCARRHREGHHPRDHRQDRRGGGQGYVLEFRGSAIRSLSMEGRMTICNMSIEAGARAGMVAPDETTFAYVKGRRTRRRGRTGTTRSPTGGRCRPTRAPSTTPRSSSTRRARAVRHLGHQPRSGRLAVGVVPDPASFADPTSAPPPSVRSSTWTSRRHAAEGRDGGCRVHGLVHEQPHRGPARLRVGHRGPQKADGVRVMVVPARARAAGGRGGGLDKVFTDFGAEWRFAGCSMCLGMNPDQLARGAVRVDEQPQLRRRQGKGGRTHLVSPLVAAATAVLGRLASPSDLPVRWRPDMEKFTTHTGVAAR
jgi:3-isopropylmalate/(R)-2-methylmalate dehydratase large subunit